MPRKELDTEAKFRQASIDGTINPEDAKLAHEFVHKYNALKCNTDGSRRKYFYSLQAFLTRLNQRGLTVSQLNEDEVYALFEWLKKQPWSEPTKDSYWRYWVRFYKWTVKRYGADWDEKVKKLIFLGDSDELLKYTFNSENVKQKSVFSADEVLELLQYEPDLCFKTLYGVLFDGGMRIGEALSIKMKGVTKTETGVITLAMEKSKTRKRPVVLERGISVSITYMDAYLRQHKAKHIPESPLFINNFGRPVDMFAARYNLKKLVQRVAEAQTDSDKKKNWLAKDKVSPHCFRHSRATDLANRGLNESMMAQLLGWSAKSKMPAVYIRGAQLDPQAALRKAHGIIDSSAKEVVKTKFCRVCHTPNIVENDYCDLCKHPFPELMAKQEAEEKQKLTCMLDGLLRTRFEHYDEKLAQLQNDYSAKLRN